MTNEHITNLEALISSAKRKILVNDETDYWWRCAQFLISLRPRREVVHLTKKQKAWLHSIKQDLK